MEADTRGCLIYDWRARLRPGNVRGAVYAMQANQGGVLAEVNRLSEEHRLMGILNVHD